MRRGHDIICISSIDWDFIWQGHQEIMATLAGQGNRVLFIENTGVRAAGVRDIPRLWQRLRNWRRGTKGFRQEREGLFVYSPVILPFPYARLARWINRWLLLRALGRWMQTMAFRPSIVWTFLPTPLARDVIQALQPDLTVYYCIDDLASSSPAAKRIRHSEARLFREADLVFVTSQKLYDRARQFNERVHLFPFGVDLETFERIRAAADEVPADLRQIPRPIVGYVGGLHQWVDQPLLAAAAAQLPHVNFVLVGPPQTDLSSLRQASNIYCLGARPHEDVPHYLKGFDVGIIPYHLSDYTAHVYPTKLNEYLAMGLPVVATDLPEIRRFNAEHGSLVEVAKDVQSFVELTQAALQDHAPEAVRRRLDTAKRNSWQARIAQMSALMAERLQARRAEEPSWEGKLRRLYHTARQRLFSVAVTGLLSYLLLFHSPLLWVLAAPLQMAVPSRPADAIVVLAGGVGESGKAGGGYQERVKEALDLYRAGLAPAIVFSSGYTFVFQEAEMMKGLAVRLGVPASAIVLETRAASTVQNAAFVKPILEERAWHSILLVSSPYHMRRAVGTFRKQAPGVVVYPVPVPRSQFYDHGWGASAEQIGGIVQEYAALLYYWWKGWL